ncbi:hypothetical protein X747_24710 [Mesorhizobium sp. LNJC384A00]|uniref:hypothetical protein n=1 Tax=Mesorhizobium sp. LNJC384A00 TaxID=1287268 RepID=UPI0003CDF383|nr:hypothetical protein [Mesorhizobium sp. LNJC384A00]ESY37876.1 hypothetical protein X747_24710 [Mesorhizobium sp. LNJC384A00]
MQFHDELWKGELAGFADEIRNLRIRADAEHEHIFRAERPIFYSAFIVRKLIEDVAVTDKLKSRFATVNSYDSNRDGKEIFLEPMLGPLEVRDHFDVSKAGEIRISFYDLSSEIIHSDGFIWLFGGSDTSPGFAVFSHRNTLRRMIAVGLDVYVAVLEEIQADKPTEWYSQIDMKTGRVTRHAK